MSSRKPPYSWTNQAWNLFCLASGIGIWPRFIEPNLVWVTHKREYVPHWPATFNGFTLVQCSDLHIAPHTAPHFLARVQKKIASCHPDLVVFTGDFLCGGRIYQGDLLRQFIETIHAKYGCFAILGNHDYDQYLCLNDGGQYDVNSTKHPTLSHGLQRLIRHFYRPNKICSITPTKAAQEVLPHPQLQEILESTHCKLLHNVTDLVPVDNSFLNLVGLGEYMGGQCLPEKAFSDYQKEFPGIILTHNPDSFPLLAEFPGDYIFAGHTHGAQINIPFLRERLTLLENPSWYRGWIEFAGKKAYINRGLGSVVPFRWFSPPEILKVTFCCEC